MVVDAACTLGGGRGFLLFFFRFLSQVEPSFPSDKWLHHSNASIMSAKELVNRKDGLHEAVG